MSAMTGIMVQTTVLVTAVLAVRKLLGAKLHAYIRYGLWLLVALRLLIPVNFIDSPVSVLRAVNAVGERFGEAFFDRRDSDSGPESGRSNDMAMQERLPEGENGSAADELWGEGENAATGGLHFAAADNAAGKEGQWVVGAEDIIEDERMIWDKRNTASVIIVFRWVWIAGSLLVGGMFLGVHLRFYRRLYRMRQLCRGGRTMDKSCGRLEVYQVKKLETPCLVGVFRPAVYIGTDIRPGTDRFRYVVAHERMHYLHGDHIWALLRVVLVTVYWFHPFVWIAASASARDGEIACDHGVIRRLGDGARLTYGEMLLDLSRKNRDRRMYSYGTMLRPGRSELKERIVCLTERNGARLSAGILAVLLMLVMAGCAFTGVSRKDADSENTGDDTRQVPEQVERGSEDPDADMTNGSDAGEADFDPEAEIDKMRQLVAEEAVISGETMFGADGPRLDYAGQTELDGTDSSVIIFHDYFGLIVYDLTNREIIRSLDLAAIGCQFTQGDNVCQVAVSNDGRSVWLHPMKMRYMFHYEVDRNLLWQLPIVKSFEVDLETEDLFNRYLVTEMAQNDRWQSNYLYEEYKDKEGLQTAYIYLTVSEDAIFGDLECVWDDMIFTLWDENAAALSNRSAGEFPYTFDNAVEDVLLTYREPCVYSRISDTFGERIHPASGETRVHEGIDYVAAKDSDIMAAADGTVYETGFLAEYGNYVVLLHANGDMTYYCHCQDIIVSEQEQVQRGQKIATVGNSGRSTGYHLHFALSQNGVFVDPLKHMELSVVDSPERWKDVEDKVKAVEEEYTRAQETAAAYQEQIDKAVQE